jgi:uncharacterized protein (TIGR02996 family)
LRILQENPDDDQIRLEYCNWLEQIGDKRAEYARLMIERLHLQDQLTEIDKQLQAFWPGITENWLDIVFPLRIRSPTVGRFFTKASPDSPPFVAVGDTVAPDTVVCLIEEMKLYNEIAAGVSGVVAEVVATNGEAVKYNQTLFRIVRLANPWW